MTEPLVELRFTVPRAWREELHAAAAGQAISMADLLRLVVRRFLRERYTDAEREALS